MDSKEKKNPRKSGTRTILPPKKLKDIKKEVGEDTTVILKAIKGQSRDYNGSLSTEMKQTFLVEQTPIVDISESKIINVRKRPNIENLIEVKNFGELEKVEKTFKFINRYENDKELIYFVSNYFYKVDRE